jgi:hypothetical protein
MANSSRFHRAQKRRKELVRQEKLEEKKLRREALRKAAEEARARGEEVYTSDQEMVRALEGDEVPEPEDNLEEEAADTEQAVPEGEASGGPDQPTQPPAN